MSTAAQHEFGKTSVWREELSEGNADGPGQGIGRSQMNVHPSGLDRSDLRLRYFRTLGERRLGHAESQPPLLQGDAEKFGDRKWLRGPLRSGTFRRRGRLGHIIPARSFPERYHPISPNTKMALISRLSLVVLGRFAVQPSNAVGQSWPNRD